MRHAMEGRLPDSYAATPSEASPRSSAAESALQDKYLLLFP